MKGSPQLENGYTKIANELLNALMKIYLSNYERRVIDCIIRYTYGFGRKKARLSLTFIGEATSISSPHIARSKKKLLEKNMITQIGTGELALQKNYEKWKLPKQVVPKQAVPKQATGSTQTGSTQTGNKKLPKQVLKKENIKKTLKDSTTKKEKLYKKREYLEKIPAEDIEKFKEKFGFSEVEIKRQAERAINWLRANGKIKKNHKAFLRNWLDKNKEFKKEKTNFRSKEEDLPPKDWFNRPKEIDKVFQILTKASLKERRR